MSIPDLSRKEASNRLDEMISHIRAYSPVNVAVSTLSSGMTAISGDYDGEKRHTLPFAGNEVSGSLFKSMRELGLKGGDISHLGVVFYHDANRTIRSSVDPHASYDGLTSKVKHSAKTLATPSDEIISSGYMLTNDQILLTNLRKAQGHKGALFFYQSEGKHVQPDLFSNGQIYSRRLVKPVLYDHRHVEERGCFDDSKKHFILGETKLREKSYVPVSGGFATKAYYDEHLKPCTPEQAEEFFREMKKITE